MLSMTILNLCWGNNAGEVRGSAELKSPHPSSIWNLQIMHRLSFLAWQEVLFVILAKLSYIISPAFCRPTASCWESNFFDLVCRIYSWD